MDIVCLSLFIRSLLCVHLTVCVCVCVCACLRIYIYIYILFGAKNSTCLEAPCVRKLVPVVEPKGRYDCELILVQRPSFYLQIQKSARRCIETGPPSHSIGLRVPSVNVYTFLGILAYQSAYTQPLAVTRCGAVSLQSYNQQTDPIINKTKTPLLFLCYPPPSASGSHCHVLCSEVQFLINILMRFSRRLTDIDQSPESRIQSWIWALIKASRYAKEGIN